MSAATPAKAANPTPPADPRHGPGIGGRELLGWMEHLEPLVGAVDVPNLTVAVGPGWTRGQVWGEVKHLLDLGFVRRRGQFLELTLAARRWADQHKGADLAVLPQRCPTAVVTT